MIKAIIISYKYKIHKINKRNIHHKEYLKLKDPSNKSNKDQNQLIIIIWM